MYILINSMALDEDKRERERERILEGNGVTSNRLNDVKSSGGNKSVP